MGRHEDQVAEKLKEGSRVEELMLAQQEVAFREGKGDWWAETIEVLIDLACSGAVRKRLGCAEPEPGGRISISSTLCMEIYNFTRGQMLRRGSERF